MKYSRINTHDENLSLLSGFALVVLVFSVIRGLVPILANNASLTMPTYHSSAIFGIVLSCYGLHAAFTNSNIGKWPHRLLILNFFLYLYWVVPVVILGLDFKVIADVVYCGLFPFSVYGLIRIPEKRLIPILGFLTLVIAAFIIWDFISLNTLLIPDGFNKAVERQELLRPDNFEGHSRTGMIRRANGLLGSRPHDSGNMLAIFFVYWIAMLFRARAHRILISGLAIVTLIGLLCSQSASNILAMFVGTLFVFVMYRKIILSHAGILPLVILLLVASFFIWGLIHYGIDLDMLWVWSDRVSTDKGDWEGMSNLGISYHWGDLYAVLFGHGSISESQIGVSTELAFIKLLVELGLIHWIVLISLLFYPATLFFSNKLRAYRQIAVPYIAAVLVGVLTLWHYGSVLRTTNIFVFFALYAQGLRIYRDLRDQKQR